MPSESAVEGGTQFVALSSVNFRPERPVWRVFDVVVALTVIALTWPLFIAVALAVWLADGGPVIFAHRRIGYRGNRFDCLKFRSMMVDADARLATLLREDPDASAEWARDHKLRRDPRVTSIGAFLRRTSLDELPQFINVLRGEMSIVGPRPIIESEAVRYGRRLSTYWSVRPGITGLWQVSGRNDISYRRRVAIDTVYAKRKRLKLDLVILLLTLPAVLLSRGSC